MHPFPANTKHLLCLFSLLLHHPRALLRPGQGQSGGNLMKQVDFRADQPEPRLAIPRKWRTEFSTCNTLRSKARRGSIHDNSTGAKSKAKNVYIPVSLLGTVDPLQQRITRRGSRRPRHSQERQHSDQTPSSRSRDPASVTAAPLHSRTSPPTAPWRQPPSGSRHLRCR